MAVELHGTGHRPDPDIVRQRRAKFHILSDRHNLGAAPRPLSTNNRAKLATTAGGPGILNQSVTQSCEGHAFASGVTLRFAILGTPIPLASPIAAYDFARVLGRTPNPDGTLPALTDTGTEPSLVIQGATQFGICTAATYGDYPANPATINLEPTPQELQAAREFELNGAYFFSSSGDQFIYDMMTALAAGYPVLSAVAASGAIFNNYHGGILPMLDADVDHASLWIDYEWDGANLSSFVGYGANTWGVGWGTTFAPDITGGMYEFDRDFAVGYGADAAALDVVPIGAGRIS
jgi:hypothetical protein